LKNVPASMMHRNRLGCGIIGFLVAAPRYSFFSDCSFGVPFSPTADMRLPLLADMAASSVNRLHRSGVVPSITIST
jgi:hypothetical protein